MEVVGDGLQQDFFIPIEHNATCPKSMYPCLFCCRQEKVFYCGVSKEKFNRKGAIINDITKMVKCPLGKLRPLEGK